MAALLDCWKIRKTRGCTKHFKPTWHMVNPQEGLLLMIMNLDICHKSPPLTSHTKYSAFPIEPPAPKITQIMP